MTKLYDTETKCHACGGAGDLISWDGYEHHFRTCAACDGTGLSAYGRAMEDESILKMLHNAFICERCGMNKVHFRLRGYVCMSCERRR